MSQVVLLNHLTASSDTKLRSQIRETLPVWKEQLPPGQHAEAEGDRRASAGDRPGACVCCADGDGQRAEPNKGKCARSPQNGLQS